MRMRGKRGWELDERLVTPEPVYFQRRRFLRDAGLAGVGALMLACAGENDAGERDDKQGKKPSKRPGLRGQAAIDEAQRLHPGVYPAPRNETFKLDRPLTDPEVAARYNNFYEFKNDKEKLVVYAQELTLRPWTVEVTGLVEKPRTIDVDELLRKLPVEERLYRHRCVERWAMAVPWIGIPMRSFIEMARPLSSARHVRFVTFNRPDEAIGIREDTWYPWPYYEGLRMDEATNELTLLTTGIYGKPLPPQHGAPIRIVTPWKYGYKSIKSIVRVEFVKKQPPTFWNTLQPKEYGFLSNVNPEQPHPRWSQKIETMLGTNEERRTQLYNGYAEWVADLYAG
jgi:sulfoxide reductase catalytic subunit YedY